MGSLKPGASYVYESPGDGTVYAREVGSSERFIIGYLDEHQNYENLSIWFKIVNASKHNPALKKAMEQCILLYHLSNNEENQILHHQV